MDAVLAQFSEKQPGFVQANSHAWDGVYFCMTGSLQMLLSGPFLSVLCPGLYMGTLPVLAVQTRQKQHQPAVLCQL